MIYKYDLKHDKTGNDTLYFALRKKEENEASIVAIGIGLTWCIHMTNAHADEYDEIQPMWEDNIKDYLLKDKDLLDKLKDVDRHTCGLCPGGEYR